MNILLFEAYYGGSHKNWADQLKHHSKHKIEILGLPARHWKWRMEGAAITFAGMLSKPGLLPDNFEKPDLLIATSMLDFSFLKANLPSDWQDIPSVYYMHENQFTYPQSENDTDAKQGRDFHYGMIQFKSMLSATLSCFNSDYHRQVFFEKLEDLLKRLPDHSPIGEMENLRARAMTLHLGIQETAASIEREKQEHKVPVILWNHRWEYDKNPESFFKALYKLQEHGHSFDLIVLGSKARNYPKVFDEAKEKLASRIIHWGYAESNEEYLQLLNQSDFSPVTSNQDFFGISVMEAVLAGVTPVLPERLVYPEHFPIEQFKNLYYSNDKQLYECLVHLITNPLQESTKNDLINRAKEYLWQQQIKRYDLIFESIALG